MNPQIVVLCMKCLTLTGAVWSPTCCTSQNWTQNAHFFGNDLKKLCPKKKETRGIVMRQLGWMALRTKWRRSQEMQAVRTSTLITASGQLALPRSTVQGFESCDIMTVSGHRSKNSLKHYSKTSDSRKREMSLQLAENLYHSSNSKSKASSSTCFSESVSNVKPSKRRPVHTPFALAMIQLHVALLKVLLSVLLWVRALQPAVLLLPQVQVSSFKFQVCFISTFSISKSYNSNKIE